MSVSAHNTAPGRSLRSVTPDDDDNLPDGACRALYVAGSGTLTVLAVDDTVAVSLGVVAAGYHPISVKRVLDTGTDATGIVAIY